MPSSMGNSNSADITTEVFAFEDVNDREGLMQHSPPPVSAMGDLGAQVARASIHRGLAPADAPAGREQGNEEGEVRNENRRGQKYKRGK